MSLCLRHIGNGNDSSGLKLILIDRTLYQTRARERTRGISGRYFQRIARLPSIINRITISGGSRLSFLCLCRFSLL